MKPYYALDIADVLDLEPGKQYSLVVMSSKEEAKMLWIEEYERAALGCESV